MADPVIYHKKKRVSRNAKRSDSRVLIQYGSDVLWRQS